MRAVATIPPESAEYNLRDICGAMAALYVARQSQGITVWQLEDKSGVSYNAGHAWRHGQRSPQLSCLVAMAQTLGFAIIMRSKAGDPAEHDLRRITTAMHALDASRRLLSPSPRAIPRIAGDSMNSFYSWLHGDRDPTLGRLVDLAEALGFEIIMRRDRREDVRKTR